MQMSELKVASCFEFEKVLSGKSNKLFYSKAEVDATIAELKAQNKRLKRALWLARANFCARSCEFFSGIMSHCLIGQEDLYKRCEKKKNKYLNAMYKCRAKAEEYK
jgi:hypothetical protein